MRLLFVNAEMVLESSTMVRMNRNMPTAMRMRIQELLLIFCNAAICDYCIVIVLFSMTYGTPQGHAHRFGDKVTQNHENKPENEKIFLQMIERFETSDANAPKRRGTMGRKQGRFVQ